MSASHAVVLALVVIGIAWWVGAYNRLVRLRADTLARWADVDTALAERARQLGRVLDAAAHSYASAAPRVEALRAACRQVDAAREQVRRRRARREVVLTLRVAEGILADARSRLPAGAAGAAGDAAAARADLATADAALGFAVAAFDRTSREYAFAARQFPTIIVATLFGFHPTGTLAADGAAPAPVADAAA